MLLPEEFIVRKDVTERAMLNTSEQMVEIWTPQNFYLGPRPSVGSTLTGTLHQD